MLTYNEALDLAKNYIAKMDSSFEITYVERFSEGWYFCYQSRQYLDTGNTSYLLAGNAPVIIDKDSGAIIDTGTAYPIEKYIKEYVSEKKIKCKN
ncbi:YrhB domain-containing protein [Snodgrassella gandavensis]|uniref:YrhB domain-containing protein n=1 Tax=Snodgrassella gandavensis TaxID=2946698 RepID=UPI001EF74FDF|nr:YrhB domain-containing protein [Snodgrassella gandavensis]